MDQVDVIKTYKTLFESPEGMVVLSDLLRNCHVIDGTFSEEANKMYFREGRRSVVFEILSHLEVDLSKVRKLYAESSTPDWS